MPLKSPSTLALAVLLALGPLSYAAAQRGTDEQPAVPRTAAEARAIAEAKRARDLIGVILAQHVGPVPAGAPTHFVDGDTFDLPLRPFKGWTTPVRIRLINANTPETRSPKCPEEKSLGLLATAKTKSLLSAPNARIALSVLGGFDDYDRYLAAVTVNEVDLGEILVDAGLARVWTDDYEGQSKDYWCKRLLGTQK